MEVKIVVKDSGTESIVTVLGGGSTEVEPCDRGMSYARISNVG